MQKKNLKITQILIFLRNKALKNIIASNGTTISCKD